MSYCSYHPSNAARVQCANCARALCHYCDHRIKGYPYCQDCIILGIECLSRRHKVESKAKRRARIAAILALVPGLGAAYNRQNFKAAVHFIGVAALFELSDVTPFETFFALAGAVFYFYTIMDAYRSAQNIAMGEDPWLEEQRFKKALLGGAPFAGLLLMLAGLLMLMRMFRPFDLYAAATKLAPAALILLGGYLIVLYLKRSREEAYDARPYRVVPMRRREDAAPSFRNESRD